jgi:hypothetical protein
VSRRVSVPAVAFAALWLAAACLDISSPVTGIAAISPIIAPTPSVVVGDSLRDTAGVVQPLRVHTFGPNGDTVRDARVVFLAIDTTRKLRVDSLTGLARGDSLAPNAQVVARVMPASGSGALQTPAVALPVVPVPQSMTKESDVTLFEFTPSSDTLAASLQSPALSVKVQGGTSAVPRYIVSFEIVERPPSPSGAPSVVLVNDNGRESVVDTTDASGLASRRLRVRPSAVDADVLLGTRTVTARVRATAKYRGVPVPSPVEFTVQLRGKP